MVTSADWHPSRPLTICCGLSDGSLALWTLSPDQLAFHIDEETATGSGSGLGLVWRGINGDEDSCRSKRGTGNTLFNYIVSCCDLLQVLKPLPSYRFLDPSLSDSEACHCAIRAVRFCPFLGHPDLILSTGYDSDITVIPPLVPRPRLTSACLPACCRSGRWASSSVRCSAKARS